MHDTQKPSHFNRQVQIIDKQLPNYQAPGWFLAQVQALQKASQSFTSYLLDMKRTTILIANIGNRNLRYDNELQPAPVHARSGQIDYRAFTQSLWANFDAEKQYFGINILDSLIESQRARIDHVVLFASDQAEGERQDQDTLYAGQILARLIPEQFAGLTAECRMLQAPVTNNNALLLNYREELRLLQRQYPDAYYLICDAGGTAQQKSSLKIMFEYLFDREDFQVFYVAQGQDYKSQVAEIPPIEYRRILDAEQIISLIDHGQYAGAEEIFSRLNRNAATSPIYHLLRFCRFRQERLWLEAHKHTDLTHYPEWLHPHLHYLTAYRNLRPAGAYEGWASELFSSRAYFELCECFAIVQRNYALENYTQVVINLFRFMESYLYHVLDENLHYHFNQNFPDAQQKLIREGVIRYPNMARFFNGKRRPKGGVPLLILAAENVQGLQYPEHSHFINSFRSINSFLNPEFRDNPDYLALDTLRHQIAHRGLGITEQEFHGIPRITKLIERWDEWLQMPAVHPYLRAHDTIQTLL